MGLSDLIMNSYSKTSRLMQRGCDFLGSETAILCGAMSWVSERNLVSAISNAGGFGVIACGAARGVLDLTIDYAKERELFGQTLSQLQNTRFRIAEMESDAQVNAAFVEQCIQQYKRGELDAATASMAKYSATEMQCRVADGCLQLFGGYGYTTEYPVSRAFTDARVQRIYGGTSEVMKEVIARSLLGRG